MNDDATKKTLASIEALLVSEMANPREALEAAYTLGRFDGASEMAQLGANRVAEAIKVVNCPKCGSKEIESRFRRAAPMSAEIDTSYMTCNDCGATWGEQ